MFGDTKIKLDKDLIERSKRYAKEAGYSSVEEFITHVLEQELRRVEHKSQEDEEKVINRLKGLGYIE